jgi:hypothetical protein
MEVAWSKVGAIRRMLEDFSLLLLHDNARPHTANKTNETLRNFKWEVLDRPPYNPDDGTGASMYREIMLRNKSIFHISTLIWLNSISICNLLIDLPTYLGSSIISSYVNLDLQHNKKKDSFKAETKYILWCLLLVYCKQVYATCFDIYFGHQANSIKYKLRCSNLDAITWIHIMQFCIMSPP